MKYFFTFVILLAPILNFACINEYGTLLNGDAVLQGFDNGRVWSEETDTVELINKSQELFEAYTRTDSVEYLSDYAATLIYLGNYEKAIEIYLELEKEHSGLYTTASNLGTAYELIGKPDSALYWIKKSVEINPNSHNGSEWIHIKILEFKISGSTDYSSSILSLDFGNDVLPTNPDSLYLSELSKDIWHQLHERGRFVTPKNLIVGNIYFDLGTIYSQTASLESALESYEAAQEYGFESELMTKRMEHFRKLTRKAKYKTWIKRLVEDYGTILLVGFSMFFIGIFLIVRYFRKRRKRRRQNNQRLLKETRIE